MTGGDGITPPSTTIDLVELVNAIFSNYAQKAIDGTSILAGDRRIVCNGDVLLVNGDIIREGSVKYMVFNAEEITPAGVTLAVKATARRQ